MASNNLWHGLDPEFSRKCEALAARIETEKHERNVRIHGSARINAAQARGERTAEEVIAEGGDRRFVRIWIVRNDNAPLVPPSKSIAYFVEVSTGKIYGARSWKAYNKARLYGTLDTVTEWYWGEYYATHKNGQNTLVPKKERV